MVSDLNESTDLLGALECLLFMADHPLALHELGDMLGISAPAVRQLLEGLAQQYRGLQIVEVAGGYELATKSEYAEYLARLYRPPRLRLTPAALETLAIIAYRQPITRPEIESLRGVNADSVVNTLLDNGLICERGQKSAPGRPMTYGTTETFLKMFGLANLDDLPDLANFIEPRPPLLKGFADDWAAE